MRKETYTKIILLILVMLILLCFFGCNRNKSNLITSEYIDVGDSSEIITKESIDRNIPIDLIESMSIFDAALLFEPITEIEMIFVEGGSMIIQGQEISLDSFYISKYVLNEYLHINTFNWAYDRGYLGRDTPKRQISLNGVPNAMLTWREAIVISNWLSIKNGLTPVYWKENGITPLLSSGDIHGSGGISVTERDGYMIQNFPFFIDWNANGYRLATEAEWEFAARGGNESNGYRYAGSNLLVDVLTTFNDYNYNMSYISGLRKPNELGIHDMSGQSLEWVLGPWTEYGELKPLHNPGRVTVFNFIDPFYLLQKSGNMLINWEERTHSFGPESRDKVQPDSNQPDFFRENERVSVRLVRGS